MLKTTGNEVVLDEVEEPAANAKRQGMVVLPHCLSVEIVLWEGTRDSNGSMDGEVLGESFYLNRMDCICDSMLGMRENKKWECDLDGSIPFLLFFNP